MYTCVCVFNFIKKLFIDSFMWLFMTDSYVYSVVFCVFHVFMSLFIFLWDWSTLITFEVNRMVVSFPWSHWWQKSLDDPWPGENHSKERLVHQRLCVEAQLFEDKDSSFSWKNEIARGYTPSAIYRWSWRVGGWVSELWRCVRGFLTVLCFKHFWFTYLFSWVNQCFSCFSHGETPDFSWSTTIIEVLEEIELLEAKSTGLGDLG